MSIDSIIVLLFLFQPVCSVLSNWRSSSVSLFWTCAIMFQSLCPILHFIFDPPENTVVETRSIISFIQKERKNPMSDYKYHQLWLNYDFSDKSQNWIIGFFQKKYRMKIWYLKHIRWTFGRNWMIFSQFLKHSEKIKNYSFWALLQMNGLSYQQNYTFSFWTIVDSVKW